LLNHLHNFVYKVALIIFRDFKRVKTCWKPLYDLIGSFREVVDTFEVLVVNTEVELLLAVAVD